MTHKKLLCGLSACMAFAFSMQGQANTPPWNGNLTVLGFVDMTSAQYVKPWTLTTADPSGACSNAAAVQYNTVDHKIFSCDSGTWTATSGSGGGGGTAGYSTIQINGGGVTQRAVMNFASPFSVTDNAGATRTDITLPQATSSVSGYLSAADWTTFNNKQLAGSYLIDPGANGLVFRTNVNITRAATNADISTLLTNIFTNGGGTGVGPTSFVPNPASDLQVFDNTAATGSTLMTLQEGIAQGTNSIQEVVDNTGNRLGRLAFTNTFPYWLLEAPDNFTNFGSFGVDEVGDPNVRLKMGLDQGAPFISFGPGSTTYDVGLERIGVNNLQITNGSGQAFKGNLFLNNLNIAGTCTGCGSTTAITQLTGDVTAGPGPGSVAATLATVNSSPGTCGDATHVCQIVDNGKGLVTSQTPIVVSGGSGASLATQLLDFAPGTVTASAIPFGASCTGGTPCYVNLGGTKFPFTSSVTLNITGGAANDTIWYYVDSAGNRTMGYNSVNTYTCTNCEVPPVSGITAFPATSYQLYACSVTAGAFVACFDNRPILAYTPIQNGLGTTVAQSGSVKQFNVTETTRAVTGTSDSLANTDCGGYVRYNNSAAVTVSLPQAGLSSQFVTGCAIEIHNYGAGTVTITPSGSTIGGAANLAITTGGGQRVISDGTNYQIGAGGGGGGGGVTAPLTLSSSTSPQLILTDPANITTSIQFSGASGAWSINANGTSAANQKIFFKNHVSTNNTLVLDPTNDTVSMINLATSSFQTALRRVTAATDTATLADGTVLCDATSNNIVETMPASALNGDLIVIKRVDASTHTVTLTPQAGTTIEGNATVPIGSGTALHLQFETSTNTWWII